MASGRSRTAGSVSRMSKKSPQPRRLRQQAVEHAHDPLEPPDHQPGKRHEVDDLADGRFAVQDAATARSGRSPAWSAWSPRASAPRRWPTTTAPGIAPPATGRRRRAGRDLGIDAREALHQRDIAERIGGAFGEVRIVMLDRALHRLGLAEHEPGQDAEDSADHDQESPSRQLMNKRHRHQHEYQGHRGRNRHGKIRPRCSTARRCPTA